MNGTFSDGLGELYHHTKFGEDRAVGVKMCLFFGHAQESGALCCRAVHSSNKHCVAVYRPISTCFAAFFQKE